MHLLYLFPHLPARCQRSEHSRKPHIGNEGATAQEGAFPRFPSGGELPANQRCSPWIWMDKETSIVFEPLYILEFVRAGSIALTNTKFNSCDKLNNIKH